MEGRVTALSPLSRSFEYMLCKKSKEQAAFGCFREPGCSDCNAINHNQVVISADLLKIQSNSRYRSDYKLEGCIGIIDHIRFRKRSYGGQPGGNNAPYFRCDGVEEGEQFHETAI